MLPLCTIIHVPLYMGDVRPKVSLSWTELGNGVALV
jgi:hypothetical protein